jgi:hypothetical protein
MIILIQKPPSEGSKTTEQPGLDKPSSGLLGGGAMLSENVLICKKRDKRMEKSVKHPI